MFVHAVHKSCRQNELVTERKKLKCSTDILSCDASYLLPLLNFAVGVVKGWVSEGQIAGVVEEGEKDSTVR